MKKTKTYSAEEVAEMMQLVHLIELEYFIMWSSIEERLETTDKIYQKLEEVYKSEVGEKFGYRQEFYRSEEALRIAGNVLIDGGRYKLLKKRNFVKVWFYKTKKNLSEEEQHHDKWKNRKNYGKSN